MVHAGGVVTLIRKCSESRRQVVIHCRRIEIGLGNELKESKRLEAQPGRGDDVTREGLS